MKPCLAAAAGFLVLAGCFVFDNPFDRPPSASFRIVVTSDSYGGTYEWDPTAGANGAFESNGAGSAYYFYCDPMYPRWTLSDEPQTGGVPLATTTLTGTALPPSSGGYWSPESAISSVNNGEGGIWVNGSPSYAASWNNNTLQVHYAKSDATDTAAFQWQSADGPAGPWTDISSENEDSLVTTWAYLDQYLRVVVTPSDKTGVEAGAAAASPPLYVSGP